MKETIVILAVVVLLAVVGGGFYYYETKATVPAAPGPTVPGPGASGGGKGPKDANGHNTYGTWANPVDPNNPAKAIAELLTLGLSNVTWGEGSFLTTNPKTSNLDPLDTVIPVSPPNPAFPNEVQVVNLAAQQALQQQGIVTRNNQISSERQQQAAKTAPGAPPNGTPGWLPDGTEVYWMDADGTVPGTPGTFSLTGWYSETQSRSAGNVVTLTNKFLSADPAFAALTPPTTLSQYAIDQAQANVPRHATGLNE